MYATVWDQLTGGVRLVDVPTADDLLITTELRPVFYEELDLLGFDAHWNYPRVQAPLLWTSSSGHIYHYRGRPVAKIAGGGLYEKPRIVECEEGLTLSPVDLPAMVEANAAPLDALAQEAIEFVHGVVQRRGNVDVVAVAFSGGKDSLVLLDIARRALPPACFHVVFSDTTMEIPPTLEAVARARARWPELVFHTARCHMDAVETWERFGPPSRIHRWCCAVHKSVPNLLKLREITGLSSVRALVLDGVRAAESENRSGYARESVSKKHATQINASPLLRWSAAEVYLHLFRQDLFLNTAYRYGFSRVGCSVCPMASRWSDFLCANLFNADVEPLVRILEKYSTQCGKKDNKEYLDSRAWKVRSGGRYLHHQRNLVHLNESHKGIEANFSFANPESIRQWLKTLGPIIWMDKWNGDVVCNNFNAHFAIDSFQKTLYFSKIEGDRPLLLRLLKAICNKAEYCQGCMSCVTECSKNAITMNSPVYIDGDACVHCYKCYAVTEHGCYAARSLRISKEDTMMKGLNRYQGFGLQKQWLEDFLHAPNDWWNNNNLGSLQFKAMEKWLDEAGIVQKKSLTPFGGIAKRQSANSPFVWNIIWANLFYNSKIVPWYLSVTDWHRQYTRAELKTHLGDDLSERSKENVIKVIMQLLKETPFGDQMRLGVISGTGKNTSIQPMGLPEGLVDPITVLYVLYCHAQHKQQWNFTTESLRESDEGGPFFIYGISTDTFIKVAHSLSVSYSKYFSSALVKDLSNINLKEGISPAEVLHLA